MTMQRLSFRGSRRVGRVLGGRSAPGTPRGVRVSQRTHQATTHHEGTGRGRDPQSLTDPRTASRRSASLAGSGGHASAETAH